MILPLPNFNEVITALRNFFFSTNFYLAVIIFVITFILVRKILKILQWLLGIITALWFTALTIYFLISLGLMDKIVNFVNALLNNLGL